MEIIDSSAVFHPRGNLTARLVKPVKYPTDFQKVSIPFTDIYVNEYGQNDLNSSNLIKETPKKCWVERDKFSN